MVVKLTTRKANKVKSYQEIAESYNLWIEYVDPAGVGTQEWFDSISIPERIDWIVRCFGKEGVEQ